MPQMKFAGRVMAFKKRSGDESNDDDTIIEATQMAEDGTVEIKFSDRDEDVYLKFKLSDLMTSLCALRGEKPESIGAKP